MDKWRGGWGRGRDADQRLQRKGVAEQATGGSETVDATKGQRGQGMSPCPALPRCRTYPYILVLYSGSHKTRGDLAVMARPYLGGSPWPPSQVEQDYILSLVCQPDRLPSSL